MTSVRRMYVLLCGFEIIPKTISTRDIGARFIMSEPISAYLLDTASGWVLLDTGMDPANTGDPLRAQEIFAENGWYPPVVSREHQVDVQLEQIGIRFEDIGHVVMSHLHLDHTGYLKFFGHARISIQRREHEAAFGGEPPEGYIPGDYDIPGLDWNIVDGDWEVVPGLTMLDTRGHTAGHQSAVVELPRSGVMVLPFDAGDLQENFDLEILPGGSVDDDAAMTAIRRLKSIVAERQGQLILLHDPVQIQTLRLAPDYYD